MSEGATHFDIDRIEAQSKRLGHVLLACSPQTYDRTLPARWFYALAKAGIEVIVSDADGEHRGHIGVVDLDTFLVWWLPVWELP